MVEREQHQTFDGFVQEAVVFVHHVFKEDVGGLAAQFQRGGNQVVGSGLGNHAACGGGAGEGDFGDALAGCQRHTGFAAIAVDDVEHTSRQQIGNQIHQNQNADGGVFSGFEHHTVTSAQGGGQFPCRHQDGEVPRNDLTDHAQWLVNVVGHGVLVDLADAAFLGAYTARKVAEVIDGQRNVGVQGFADGLAVVHGFGVGQAFQIGFQTIGNFQ